MSKIDNVTNKAIPEQVLVFDRKPGSQDDRAAQLFPANSMVDMVQHELVEVDKEALAETQEDLSLALGGRFRELRGGDGKSEALRTRAMLARLIAEVNEVAAVDLNDLLGRFGDLAQHPDPLGQLRQAQLNSGEMVLVLAGLLANAGALSKTVRKRLENALAELMDDEEWELNLFTRIEFGSASVPATLTQIKKLYQRASARQTPLHKWFEEVRSMADRNRKLKVLIRTLAFELSAQGVPISGSRLAAVITDLKRIILFLGLEQHCLSLTRTHRLWRLDAEQFMTELLMAIDQTWVTADWLQERVQVLGISQRQTYSYVQAFSNTIKLLADPCFRDDTQRSEILEASERYLHQLADAE